jgi:hypothetical protein
MKSILLSILLVSLLYGCNNSSNENSIHAGNGYLNEYHRGNITYLIFCRNNSIYVMNYTADSLEYELYTSPTKILTSGNNCDTGINSSQPVQVR